MNESEITSQSVHDAKWKKTTSGVENLREKKKSPKVVLTIVRYSVSALYAIPNDIYFYTQIVQ